MSEQKMERVVCPGCKIILATFTELTVSSITLELSTSKIKLVSGQGGINSSAIDLACPGCGQTVNIDLQKITHELLFVCDRCHKALPTTEMIDMGQSVLCKACEDSLIERMRPLVDKVVERNKRSKK